MPARTPWLRLVVASLAATLFACGGASSHVAEPSAGSSAERPTTAKGAAPRLSVEERLAAAPCVAPDEASLRALSKPDLDSDGTPDLLAEEHDRDVVVYLRRGSCLRRLTKISPDNGAIAFATANTVTPKNPVCDIWVDTWLYHGDRERSAWRWAGTGYFEFSSRELVHAPKR